jgi:hypothetical protein
MADPRRNLNRLAKWRSLFAGWQLGTRPIGDPECDAVRDHREATIIQRAELSALTGLLIEKGVFTAEEFGVVLAHEADQLSQDYERRFPGVKATDIGLEMDGRAAQTMKGWLS